MSTKKSLFDQQVFMDWPAVWARLNSEMAPVAESDDGEGTLCVREDASGDMHLVVYPGLNQRAILPSFRARTKVGGGHHERIRTALALLALAIVEDTEEDQKES